MDHNRKIVGLLLALVVVSSGVAAPVAAQSDVDWEDELLDLFETHADTFNEQIDDVDLGPAGDRLAGKTVKAVVTGEEETVVFTFTMDENNHITDLQAGDTGDADLKMTTSKATIERVLNADNPAQAFRDAYANDDIRIKTDYGLGEAVTSGRIVDWGFWTAADTFKGVFF
jgi:hypothetical protein